MYYIGNVDILLVSVWNKIHFTIDITPSTNKIWKIIIIPLAQRQKISNENYWMFTWEQVQQVHGDLVEQW